MFAAMSRRVLACLFCLMIGTVSARADVGLLPTPTLQGVQTHVVVTFDSTAQVYNYAYTVNNPSSNTGKIWMVKVDTTTRFPKAFTGPFDASGLSIPFGASTVTFDDFVSMLGPLQLPPTSGYLVAYGQQVPTGWAGGLDIFGVAHFSTLDANFNVAPGSQVTELVLQSRGLPTIRPTQAVPFWQLVVNTEEEVTPAQEQAATQISQSIVFQSFTLGPSGVSAGSYGHWDQLRDDLNQAVQLGWISDSLLANALVAQLASARQALDAHDGTLAKTRLNTLIQTISASTVAQRLAEVAALVLFNAQALRDNTNDTPIPLEPRMMLTPSSIQLPIGSLHTVTATVLNHGVSSHPPVPNFSVTFRINDGPNSGFEQTIDTDAIGQAVLTFTSSMLGADRVLAGIGGEVFEEQATATVTWAGGSDLAVPLFVPPVLQSQGGNPVTITEWTQNIGSVAAPPSVTRYYLSTTNVVDPQTALVLGQRSVPALAPGEQSQGASTTLTLPSSLPAGTYQLAACADAPEQVVELQEENNCSFNILNTSRSVVVPQGFFGTPNNSPVCTTAVPSTPTLWPPNHKLATVSVQGVTDPNSDPVTIKINAITQDEPVNGLGDGDTAPDGSGVGTAQAQLRKERAGTGNGRVYALWFQADDGNGGTCSGTVRVGVPHDQGPGGAPIDNGQNYDSTHAP